MKGHVKIELFDHKTGKLVKREHENMLTNALAYRAGIDANDTLTLYSSDYSIMSLGTKGLGGLLMEDRLKGNLANWMHTRRGHFRPAKKQRILRGQDPGGEMERTQVHDRGCGRNDLQD